MNMSPFLRKEKGGTTESISPAEELGTVEDFRGIKPESADNVLAFLHQRGHVIEPMTAAEEKALVRKIDRMLVPLMLCIYLLQYLDKTLINFAAVMGIKKDTGMTTQEFSYLALAFYVSYCVCEPVHAYCMQRLPTARYLGVMVSFWGVAVATTAACKTYPALIVTRVFLGAFESCVAPCLMLITTMWYTVHEQPLRTGIWYCGTGIGTIIGGLVSFGFQHYAGHVGFRSWQVMFLAVGLVTVVAGALAAVLLPDNPTRATRLSERERFWAIERLRRNQTGIENKTFKWAQCREGLLDPHVWLLCLTTIASCIPNGMVSSFQATIIASLGFTSRQSALLSLASGAVALLAIATAAVLAARFDQRAWACELQLAVGVVGASLVAFTHRNGSRLAGIFLCNAIGAALPLLYAWAEANTAGHTKKVTVNAMLLMAFAVGNIIGPLTFRNVDAPQYIPAKIAVVVTTAFAMLVAASLRYLCLCENTRRDRLVATTHEIDIEFADRTDRLNAEFRYRL